jgi:hypothetical protein
MAVGIWRPLEAWRKALRARRIERIWQQSLELLTPTLHRLT